MIAAFVRYKRNSTHAHTFALNTLRPLLQLQLLYFTGSLDKLQRPIVVIHLHKYTGRELLQQSLVAKKDALFELLAMHLELARTLYTSPFNKSCLLIFNCAGAGISNLDMEIGTFLLDLLYKYYPDSIGKVCVHSMPWILRSAWSMVSAILPPTAHSRIQFTSTSNDLLKEVSADQLPIGNYF